MVLKPLSHLLQRRGWGPSGGGTSQEQGPESTGDGWAGPKMKSRVSVRRFGPRPLWREGTVNATTLGSTPVARAADVVSLPTHLFKPPVWAC